MAIKVLSVVLCDDIRQEANGKHILIGVYSGVLGIRSLPVTLRLSWWIQLLADPGKYEIDIRIIGPNDAQLMSGKIMLESIAAKPSAFIVPKTAMQIQAEGIVRLEWNANGEWETVGQVEVVIGNPQTAAAAKPTGTPTPKS